MASRHEPNCFSLGESQSHPCKARHNLIGEEMRNEGKFDIEEMRMDLHPYQQNLRCNTYSYDMNSQSKIYK